MLASTLNTLKEYVVLRVDEGDGFHRELAAESAIEGEALRVGRMLSEEAAVSSSSICERGVSYEVRLSRSGELLDSFPVPKARRPEEDDERLLEFPMCFAVVA